MVFEKRDTVHVLKYINLHALKYIYVTFKNTFPLHHEPL